MKTIREAAPIIGITPRGLYERVARKQIPGAVKQGKTWLIPDEILDKYVGTLNVSQAADFVARHGGPRSKQTIYNYIREGRITPTTDHLGIMRIPQKQLEDLLGLEEREAAKRAQRELQP